MANKTRKTQETVVIHFAGDSGDGMQVTGTQFSLSSAILGNDVHTFPDFPAEIRAPAGTLPGVSGFQLSFSSLDIHTPGDLVDVLVVMNPAALKVNLAKLKDHCMIVADLDKFVEKDYLKAGYTSDPLDSVALAKYKIVRAPITSLTLKALAELDISRTVARKCKNMFALGILYWLFNRDLEHTLTWFKKKFKDDILVIANSIALKAGYNYAMTAELFNELYTVDKAQLPKGHYRQITGNEALALACLVACVKSHKSLLVAGYPITPSSDILHYVSRYQAFGVKTFQAEDEMAAAGAALGAGYGGNLALTCTSGPGMDLKGEMIGLAVMAELPMVIVDVQRAGPSTGMPTKVEQADLFLALHGRHGECPVPVLAPKSPGDCFDLLLEAFRLAVKYMTPVIVLSDAYIANSSEPWLIPEIDKIPSIPLNYVEVGDLNFQPYKRAHNLSRPFAIPGTPGFEHRIGGLEKENGSGNISYSATNHQEMVDLRLAKINNIAHELPKLVVQGQETGDVLVISWGGTWGAVETAVVALQLRKYKISAVHLRYLFPLQKELGAIVKRFKYVVVAELNKGQLCSIIRDKFLVDAQSISKVAGQPFTVSELIATLHKFLEAK